MGYEKGNLIIAIIQIDSGQCNFIPKNTIGIILHYMGKIMGARAYYVYWQNGLKTLHVYNNQIKLINI